MFVINVREPYDPKPILGAALTLVGGHSTPMDIVEIEVQDKVMHQVFFSFENPLI